MANSFIPTTRTADLVPLAKNLYNFVSDKKKQKDMAKAAAANTDGTNAQNSPDVAMAATAEAAAWDCACGHQGNSGKFCAECGQPKPTVWDCACGYQGNAGKFCSECGKPKPIAWDCACGYKGNAGKFCVECGQPMP